MRERLSNRDYQLISAYLDQQLTQNERRRFEERLRTHPELQTALDEMSRTRTLLRQAPRRRAPRNFTLTSAMAAENRPQPRRGLRSSTNLFPVLSFTSALAALVLVATLIFRLFPGPAGQNGEMTSMAAVPTAAAPPASTMAAVAPAVGAAPSTLSKSADNAANAVSGGPAINWNAGMGETYYGASGASSGENTASAAPYLGDLLGPPAASSNPPTTAPVYGMGGGASGSSVILPPEAVQGLSTEPRAQIQGFNSGEEVPQMGGAGPILGLPSPAEGGQIIEERSIQGFPVQPDQRSQTEAAPAEERAQPSDSLLGLSRLTILQILLGVIAAATGIAAVVIRRRAA